MTQPDQSAQGGYGNRTLTQTFDDLAPGMHVTIKNPALLPSAQLAPRTDISGIKNAEQREKIVNGWLASFIVDWHIYDVRDFGDAPLVLGPPNSDTIGGCPSAVTSWIVEKIREVSDPR